MASRIIKKESLTNQQKLSDLLEQTKQEGDCLIWTRSLNTDGYPHMFGNIKVHRLVKELDSGEDLTGWIVRHTCDQPKCINPKHLLKGTFSDNGNDKFIRNRQPRVVTKEIVFRVRALLELNFLNHKQIADLVGINPRRVSDIKHKLYNDEGKFVRH